MTDQKSRIVFLLKEWNTLSYRLATRSPADMHSLDHLHAATDEMLHELEKSAGTGQEESQAQSNHEKPAGEPANRSH